MVERHSLGIAALGALVGVDREIGGLVADMDGPAAQLRRPAPALVPAAQIFEQLCAALRIGNRDIDVFELALGHGNLRYLCPTRKGANHRLAQSATRSEEHTSELQSLMRISYAVFCLKNK